MNRLVSLLSLSCLLSCGKDVPEGSDPPIAQPGPLQVGVARVRMPVPVGIGTAGYGGFDVQADPSPFAEIYPATTRIHQHPDLRAIVISRGDGFEAVFLRTDTVGIFQQVRRELVLELQERLGKDLDDALIIGATHTHAGPGRVIDAGGPFELIADRFFPEFYDHLLDAMADAVELAYADLAPGRVGFGVTEAPAAIDDRRCEDGLTYTNARLPMIAVEREGELAGMLVSFPIHGTVLGIDDLTLSQDASGGIERAIEDHLPASARPVEVMMMNAWGADMSPGNPELALQEGAALPEGYDQLEAVGQVVGEAVALAQPGLEWTETPEITLRTHRTRIDREVIGYDSGEFTFDQGAVYCGAGLESDCETSTELEPEFDDVCIPFNEEWPAPNQTEITVGQLGPFSLVTFPGEPGTLLGEQVVAEIQALGAGEVLFLGYAQDYLGYSILEEDWWQGGYEATGALWGPRQGEYLAGEVVEAWAETFAGRPADDEPAPITPFGPRSYEPRVATTPVDVGGVVAEVLPTYGPTDVVTFTVHGSDPWLGAPIALLESADASGSGGDPVLRPGGKPFDSDGAGFWVDLTTDPTYADDLEAAERAFSWTFQLPVRHPVTGAVPELAGAYRIRVILPVDGGGTTEVTSAVFSVEP